MTTQLSLPLSQDRALQNLLSQPQPTAAVLCVFDSRIADLEVLRTALQPHVSTYTIDASVDALPVITQLLTTTGAQQLVIAAHGAPGVIHLGATPLDLQQLHASAHLLQEWGVAEIALYSCEVAQGECGQQFIQQLSELSGACVSAATTQVGNSVLGGSWTLDVATRTSALAVPFAAERLSHYKGLLAIQRISTTSTGAQSTGRSYAPSISTDGRYSVFLSSANNLVSGDTNNLDDVFIKDLQTGSLRRVSTSSSGAQSNGISSEASISANGRYVAFMSNGSNLVSGDTNRMRDIFVKDMQTGSLSRVSTSSSGAQSNGAAYNPTISADGRYVAFMSSASNLVSGDINAQPDIFVKDLQSGSLRQVSASSSGTGGNQGSYAPSFSANGRYVAFYSSATNLVSGDTNFAADVFVKDLQTGGIARASVSAAGAQTRRQDSYNPTLSADGRYVAFLSNGDALVSGDTNNVTDVFVKDMQTGSIRRVSTSASGAQANGGSTKANISADGRYVTFLSSASNLVSGDTNGAADVFVKDLQTGSISRVTTSNTGAQANGAAEDINISSGGRYVTVVSHAGNLTGGDTNGAADVFVKDLGVDPLTGQAGRADKFILGDASGILYDNGNSTTAGVKDFALISNFDLSQDKIQMKGSSSQYVIGNYSYGSASAQGIFLDSDRSGTLSANDDLLGAVVNAPALNLGASHFSYV